MIFRVLVVDDDPNVNRGLVEFLREEGYEMYACGNGKEAINLLRGTEIDAIISDLRMAPINGEQLLQHVVSTYPTVPVIMLTGHGTIDTAIKAMHNGAYDFLVKPTDLNRLVLLLKRALRTRELAVRNRQIQQELAHYSTDTTLFTKSRLMQKVQDVVQQVAPTNTSVLITGESGVGKEVLCDLIHRLSKRGKKPLIKVHCAALSQSLLESELFGHEKGAFTGALAQKKGRFELADEGTIFLDEIGEIDPGTQVKLLRVLQEQSFERVGGETTLKVNVRVITATNRNLWEEVKAGRFREDLFYRLSVVNIEIPPLRQRREDIVLFAQRFLQQLAKSHHKEVKGFDKDAYKALSNYNWPGNIRELRNCVENAIVMTQGAVIKFEDLSEAVQNVSSTQHLTLSLGLSLAEVERNYIHAMLMAHKWNKSKVAEMLKIGRKTLHTKINNYGISDM